MQISLQQRLDQALEEEARGNFQKAEQIYLDIIKITPSSSSAYDNLGILKARAEDYESAGWAFQHAVKNNPDSLNAQLNLAGILHLRGSYNHAESHYRIAIKLAPEDREIRETFHKMLKAKREVFLHLCSLLEYDANYFGAENIYRLAVAKIEDDPSCWCMLGVTLFIKKEYQAAKPIFEHAISLDNSLGVAWHFLSSTFAELGQKEMGIRFAQYVQTNFG